MRWNFKNVGKGLGEIADAKNRYDDAEAYKKATEVTAPEDADTLQAYRDAAGGLRGQMTGAEGGAYDTEDSGYQPGVVGMTGAASAYDTAAVKGSKYRMGGAEYDAAPTDMQKRAAGLSASRDVYASKGLKEEALKYGEAADRAKEMEDRAAASAMSRRLGQNELDQQPARMKILNAHADMAPIQVDVAKQDLEAKRFKSEFDKASRSGLPGLMGFYDKNVKDGYKSRMEKDPKNGAVSIYRVPEDDPGSKGTLWKTFKGNQAIGLDPEIEAAAAVHNLMGDPANMEKILHINAAYTSKKQHDDMMKAVYAARPEKAKSATAQMEEKVGLYAKAMVESGDETDMKVATRKAWGLIFKDPAVTKPEKEIADDPVVEVTRSTPSGEQYKVKLPMSVADPVAFRDMTLRKNAGKGGGLEDALKPKPKAAPAAAAPVAETPAPARGAPLGGNPSGFTHGVDFLTESELRAAAASGNVEAEKKLYEMTTRRRGGLSGRS